MLATIYAKTVRDRWVSVLVGAGSVIAVLGLGLAAYKDLDDVLTRLVESMPEALLSMIGMVGESGTTSLVLGEMINLIGPLVLGGLAISMGSAAVAGEERDGTMGVLLGNPRNRRQVVLSKVWAMATLVGVGTIIVFAGSWTAVVLSGSSTDGGLLLAASVHLFAIALFFGAFALFIGSFTGNATTASGSAAGLMILSLLIAGLFPLISGWENVAKTMPWYYFNGSQPLANGLDWGHLAVLLGGTALLTVGAIFGVERRDLRSGNESRSLVDRLSKYPIAVKAIERISGQAQVANIAIKTSSENQAITTVAALAIFYVAILVGPMYNGLTDVLSDLAASFPEALLAMIGFADMSTAEGWYVAEVFSITVPAAMIAVTVMMGSRALAGEERARTMDLLMANPVRRSTVVIHKAASIALMSLILGVATWAGTVGGSLIGGLSLSFTNVAAASLQAVALAILFGMIALAGGAATGQTRTSVYAGAGVAIIAWAIYSFFPVSESLASWAKLSPFYYYADNNPLNNGFSVGNISVLVAASAILVVLAVALFERRDIRG